MKTMSAVLQSEHVRVETQAMLALGTMQKLAFSHGSKAREVLLALTQKLAQGTCRSATAAVLPVCTTSSRVRDKCLRQSEDLI